MGGARWRGRSGLVAHSALPLSGEGRGARDEGGHAAGAEVREQGCGFPEGAHLSSAIPARGWRVSPAWQGWARRRSPGTALSLAPRLPRCSAVGNLPCASVRPGARAVSCLGVCCDAIAVNKKWQHPDAVARKEKR